MFWLVFTMIVTWLVAPIMIKYFGSQFTPLFIVPVFLTSLFVYLRTSREESSSKIPTKRGWVLGLSVVYEIEILAAFYLLLRFLPLTFISRVIMGAGGLGCVTLLGFVLVYFWWAPHNLFFTFVPEGRAKIVVRGDAFKKVLIQWEGHKLAEERTPDGTIDMGDVIEGSIEKRLFGGLQPYGLWPLDDILVYGFAWTNLTQDGGIQKHEKQEIDHILLKTDVYWAKVVNAEDNNLLPLDIELVLTIRVVNPYKALFRGESWLELVINTTDPAVRDVLTGDTFENWIKKPKDLGQKVFDKLKKKGLLKWLRGDYGIEMMAIGVRDINPSGDLREITLKKVIAEKNREATIVDADAERQRIAAVYEQIQIFGDLGKLVRVLEAVEKSPEKGAKWIIPIPGMADFLSQVFPGKSPETLKPEDIKTIREILEKIKQNGLGAKTS